ncbi:MAG: hypothetical protein GWN86_29635, partial [Desulfobacterales bacterium]|nr:hypothetical protein [Desulfobacterales bacterium]
GPSDPKTYFPKAKEAATRALEIDDKLPEAHVVLGGIKARFEWDWEGAEKIARRAIVLSPGCAYAHTALAMHLHEK